MRTEFSTRVELRHPFCEELECWLFADGDEGEGGHQAASPHSPHPVDRKAIRFAADGSQICKKEKGASKIARVIPSPSSRRCGS